MIASVEILLFDQTGAELARRIAGDLDPIEAAQGSSRLCTVRRPNSVLFRGWDIGIFLSES
jgi:hypothetical protein